MAFASADDLKFRLGRELTTFEQQAASTLIELATGVIAEGASKDDAWSDDLDPVPTALRALCIELVARIVANPNQLTSFNEQLGQYTVGMTFPADRIGMALTDAEELLVRRVVYGSNNGSAKLDSTLDELPLIPWAFYPNLIDTPPSDPAYWLP